MGVENLDKIFNPRRIAVIGASDRGESVGAKLIRNLVGVGYKGAVYPVNTFRPIVQGIAAYPSVEKIPRQVDLGIVATPAHTVPQIIAECGRAGIPGVIIISAGFREAGEEGKQLEKEIIELKGQYNMRIIGPNCLGVMRPCIKLNATFANKAARSGKIAFISQSAALCSSVLDWASEAHIGFSSIVSVGSMLDVDFGDLIDYFGTDPQTRSIVLYIESIKSARKFMSAARGFARAKPIVVVKAGRFRESAEAALCHTGALCGEDAVYDAAFRRAGIVRVKAISDLFNCAETLAMQPNPKGSKLTIVTNAGGPGIMATDSLMASGGKLSSLSNETIHALNEILPSYCSKMNPIDILEEATTDRFKAVLEICLKDPNSDGFLIIYTPQGASDPEDTAKAIAELSKKTTKPILTSLMGEDGCWRARSILRKNGIPAFTTPEQAVSTFMYMWSYAQNLELLYETPEELSIKLSIPAFLRKVIVKAFDEGRTRLTPIEAMQFLQAYKIPTIKSMITRTPAETANAALKIGFPVVMKAFSPQISHKSRINGIILDVRSSTETKKCFKDLAQRVKTHEPQAKFEGVILQPMVKKKGYELLIGSKKDLHFGSVIAFGMGGVATEVLRDVNTGFPPLNQVLARRLMEKTAIYKLISDPDYQHINLKLLEETLVKFSQLVIDFPEIKEIDINPLIVDKTSVIAVDTRIIIDTEKVSTKTRPHEHLVITPYPRKYTTQLKLKDGTPVTLRPIKPEDEDLLQKLFQSFSEETIRFRFFQLIKKMSHEILTRYCNIDYNREIAIIAERGKSRTRKIIGIARLIRQPGKKLGEFAVVVGDQWQGLGLGSELVDYIIKIGKDMELSEISGDVMSNNVKMLRLCKKKSFKIEIVDEETTKATLVLKA
ncbi:MAG: bifunctional acetate--CoA ligase family protein/GNAT family N-acetyltransferase [Candidatus Bathyarchaeota archaeon]|nr:MAG: bifunctional acetate--CoA ligase family protein/GNAT family N-acetyltransferase [Candidatus Bathyarchaeota archaeon]